MNIDRIADLVEASTGIAPVHEVQDEAKLGDLVAAIRENGWTGAPLVADGDQGITGAHRFHAVVALRAEGIFIELPVVQVADLADEFDIDWDTIRAEYTEYDRYIEFIDRLPADVVDYLGLDLH
ncbi:hypothetical protein [Nocardia sp. NPDC055049]